MATVKQDLSHARSQLRKALKLLERAGVEYCSDPPGGTVYSLVDSAMCSIDYARISLGYERNQV